jgi:hypothetical protein
MPTVNGSSSTTNLEEGRSKGEDVELAANHSGKELAIDFRPWMNRAPLTVGAYSMLSLCDHLVRGPLICIDGLCSNYANHSTSV